MNNLSLIANVGSAFSGIVLLVYFAFGVVKSSKVSEKKTTIVVGFAAFGIVCLSVIQIFGSNKKENEFEDLQKEKQRIAYEKDSIKTSEQVALNKSNTLIKESENLKKNFDEITRDREKLILQRQKLEINVKQLSTQLSEEKKNVQKKYKHIGQFREGSAVVKNQLEMYGYIDKRSNELTSCKFKYATSFSNGLAGVKNEFDKWGYIDATGSVHIKHNFDEANYFEKEQAIVRIGAKWYKINKKGEILDKIIKP